MSLAKNLGLHLVVVLVNFPCCQWRGSKQHSRYFKKSYINSNHETWNINAEALKSSFKIHNYAWNVPFKKKKLNLFYTVISPPAVHSKILTSNCAKWMQPISMLLHNSECAHLDASKRWIRSTGGKKSFPAMYNVGGSLKDCKFHL